MNIKFMFILGIIALILSLCYLGYFTELISDGRSISKIKFNRLILYGIFPIVSVITILYSIVYIYCLYKEFLIVFLLIIVLVLIFLGSFLIFGDEIGIGIFIIFIGMVISSLLFSIDGIKIEENCTTNTIPLYEQSVIRDDLSGVIINITSDNSYEKNYHALMQYCANDIKDFELSTSIYCTEFKLIDSQDNKLKITKKEKIHCNILYYHGFKNFTPNITDNSIECILYINEDNIVYE